MVVAAITSPPADAGNAAEPRLQRKAAGRHGCFACLGGGRIPQTRPTCNGKRFGIADPCRSKAKTHL